MHYRGRVKGNIIVIEDEVRLPEGAEVTIALVAKNRLADYAGVLPLEDADELRRMLVEMRKQVVEERVS